MMAVMLRERRRGERGRRGKGDEEPHHAAAPSIGRTVTIRIMPACMW